MIGHYLIDTSNVPEGECSTDGAMSVDATQRIPQDYKKDNQAGYGYQNYIEDEVDNTFLKPQGEGAGLFQYIKR